MKIVDQDQEVEFEMGTVFFKPHCVNNTFFGYNIYGKKETPRSKRVYLGTFFRKPDAMQIVDEINLLHSKGCERYVIPEDVMLEDIFEEEGQAM